MTVSKAKLLAMLATILLKILPQGLHSDSGGSLTVYSGTTMIKANNDG